MKERNYIAIDLKSFYASVECVERGLDPMRVNLVVADESRTEKTICLAVSPALKAYGIPGRPRLFEVVQRVREVNAARRCRAPGQRLTERSCLAEVLQSDPSAAVDYLVAPPRMALYMQYSTRIYNIYQEFVAPEDMHVYSVDEVFLDVTDYLSAYRMTATQLAAKIVRTVFERTGITATAGIGSNLYLSKVAMDIVAKKLPADETGARIAALDEQSYRAQLWGHTPITDFWRVGRGYANKLAAYGMHTMGDVARCSVQNEELLYRLFGVNAELLIDHAWGWEPCTIADIRSYRPARNSVGSGQVLQRPYSFAEGRLIVREMTELLVLDLVDRGLETDQIVLTVGYDRENLVDPAKRAHYRGEVTVDRYGREIPKHAHGTQNLEHYTSSTRKIVQAAVALYERIVEPALSVRRMYVVAARVLPRGSVPAPKAEQLDLFTDYAEAARLQEEEETSLQRERGLQQAALEIRKKFGKNALIKGMNLEEGATSVERNGQIGGHKA